MYSIFKPSCLDELKHHFASLKNNDLISWKIGVLEREFASNCLIITITFFSFATHSISFSSATSRELRQQLAACEDDNGKYRLQRLEPAGRMFQTFRGFCHHTLNDIGSLKRTLQYNHHAAPGEPCKGSPGVAWLLYWRVPSSEPTLFRVYTKRIKAKYLTQVVTRLNL